MVKKIAIIGTAGIPASYGGFETLAQNLVDYSSRKNLPLNLIVYCSKRSQRKIDTHYHNTSLKYIPFNPNGLQSILYDICSIFHAIYCKINCILLLGVSGALILPFVRVMFPKIKIVVNIDGIEWKREKWKGVSKMFLKWSEKIAINWSHEIIADNEGVAQYVQENYFAICNVIEYGGDHAKVSESFSWLMEKQLPVKYALALCRIEPENNVDKILKAFDRNVEFSLVFIGNWDNSTYGRNLKRKFATNPNIYLLDPIYDQGILSYIRKNAIIYIHGHSAGGTNPSLVEMMHFGLPVIAFDCVFNRFTTEQKALFFKSSEELILLIRNLSPKKIEAIGSQMLVLAMKRYTWERIGYNYFKLLLSDTPKAIAKVSKFQAK